VLALVRVPAQPLRDAPTRAGVLQKQGGVREAISWALRQPGPRRILLSLFMFALLAAPVQGRERARGPAGASACVPRVSQVYLGCLFPAADEYRATIQDLLTLKEMFDRLQSAIAALALPSEMVRHYATVVIKAEIFQIARRDQKRYLYLLCFIAHQYCTVQDLLMDILLKVVQTAQNSAKREQQETYFEARTDRAGAVLELSAAFESSEDRWQKVKRIVLSETLSPNQKLRQLAALVGQESGMESATIRDRLSLLRRDNERTQKDADYYDALEGQSLWLQKRA